MATYKGRNEDSSGNLLLNIGNGMTATVELSSTASQAYTKGAYLFFNNRFCKASSAISSGATLAIGTNLTETSIGTELTSHLRSSDGKEFYFDVKDGTYGYYPSASKTASEFVPFGGTSAKTRLMYWIYNTPVIATYDLTTNPVTVNVSTDKTATTSALTLPNGYGTAQGTSDYPNRIKVTPSKSGVAKVYEIYSPNGSMSTLSCHAAYKEISFTSGTVFYVTGSYNQSTGLCVDFV